MSPISLHSLHYPLLPAPAPPQAFTPLLSVSTGNASVISFVVLQDCIIIPTLLNYRKVYNTIEICKKSREEKEKEGNA